MSLANKIAQLRGLQNYLSALLSVGAAPFVARSGQVVQSVFQTNAANTVISATIPADSTIPQSSEGTQVLTATITPTSSGNTLEVEAVVHGSELTNVGDSILVALFRDAGADAVAASFVGGMNGGGNNLTSGTAVIRYRVAAGSTAATTFTVRAGNNTGSMTLNATHQNINLGGLIASTLTVREISS